MSRYLDFHFFNPSIQYSYGYSVGSNEPRTGLGRLTGGRNGEEKYGMLCATLPRMKKTSDQIANSEMAEVLPHRVTLASSLKYSVENKTMIDSEVCMFST